MKKMHAFRVFFAVFCLFVFTANAFPAKYFDSYEDDWPIRRKPFKRRPVVVSESIEVSPEETSPVEVESFESEEQYFVRPSYHHYSYYEPKPFYGGYGGGYGGYGYGGYGFKPRYGKK